MPSALLSRVLHYLDAATLTAVSRCARDLRAPASDWKLWSSVYIRRWPVSTGRLHQDWKHAYAGREASELAEGRSAHTPEDELLTRSFRVMHRALAERRIRQRDEFDVIDRWARSHRDAYQRMASAPGGSEVALLAHAPTCGQDICEYTHYPPDLWLCKTSGLVHWCGPQSDEPSHPIEVPEGKHTDSEPTYTPDELMEARGGEEATSLEAAESDAPTSTPAAAEPPGEVLLPSIPLPTRGAPRLSESAAPWSSVPSPCFHTCCFLDPSAPGVPDSFRLGLSAARGGPLRVCPVSGRSAPECHGEHEEEQADRDAVDAEMAESRLRGGSPEPEEACGRGSFLMACFEHGYHSESLYDASAVWNAPAAAAATRARPTTAATSQQAEREVIQRGRLFGLPIGGSTSKRK